MALMKDEQNQSNTPNTGSRGPSFGFMRQNISHRLSGAVGSEALSRLAEEMNVQYKTIPDANERPTVTILDRTQVPNIMFSAIVSSLKRGLEVHYYTVMIEATGDRPEPQTAQRIMMEVNDLKQIRGAAQNRRGIWVTADANDGVYHQRIQEYLATKYGKDGIDYIDVGTLIVPNIANLTDGSLARNIAANAQQACIFSAELSENENIDLNIVKAKQEEPGLMFSLIADTGIVGNHDEVGNPIRSDIHMGLIAKIGNGSSSAGASLNAAEHEKMLIDISAYVEPFPEKVNLPGMTAAGMPIQAIRFHPHIVLTRMALHDKTLGFLLAGIASSTAAINPEIWMASVIPQNAKAAKLRNPGALNKIANLNGVEGVVDLMDKSLTPDERVALINQLYMASPFFSFDVDITSPQGFYTYPLAVGAMSQAGVNRDNARQDIVEAASWLTDGIFPQNYPLNKIFATDAVIIPTGRWHDGSTNEERDIREIDLTMITTLTEDEKIWAQWVMSYENPESCFLERVDIINRIMPDAVITGKAYRVTFHPEFITTLTSAVKAAGMSTQVDPLMTFNRGIDITAAATTFAHAGISQIPTFQTSFSPNNFNMASMMFNGNAGFPMH